MARILVVDDEPKMTSLVCGALEDEGHDVTTTISPDEALRLIDEHAFDIVITDLAMPEISGMEILDKALEKEGVDVIMMTAYGTVDTAVSAMKKGAADYLLKPFSLEELTILVSKLVEKQKLSSLAGHYAQQLKQQCASEFVGSSPAAERVRRMVRQVAPTDTTVLLAGESGTGKELAARMIHDLSPRRDKAFIAVNCAAIPETLLESELFGHEKGAFTGAVGRKRGRFELAEGGTLFLDEIGEMSPAMQAKMLRVLEEKKIVRVGGVDSFHVDARLVTATNRDLRQEITTGRFREDLYFRLNVFPIALPTLSERGGDVLELAKFFLRQQNFPYPELDPVVKETLLGYDWPGNVRELRNVLERAAILSGGEPLAAEDLAIAPQDTPIVQTESGSTREHVGLEKAEKVMILKALEQAGGNKTEAARLLRISRRRLYSRMKVHGISP
ncbi:MAG TPA: sigma-54 dependent transcriptional regulator [Acidobacteriota bacterium]|nr:sigma-54 dependent transcriptional regulator [Acidobacteriota bacterium]